MIKIHNEDYNLTLPNLSNVKMVITSPPDPDEINLKPENGKYNQFLKDFCDRIINTSKLIAIVITDRKHDGIISKHSDIIQYFKNNDFRLLAHKIWVKSDKIDLFRLTYSHIMIFANGKINQHHNKDYETDVWNIPREKYEGYLNGFPLELVERIIKNFTEPRDLIYDPFMGSGTTAIASITYNRNCIGSELDKNNYDMCSKRLEELEIKWVS